MALNPRVVADAIRHQLGWTDASRSAAIILQIPQALKETGRRIAADPSTRALLVSDKATSKVAIGTDGKVNLQTAYGNYKILKEFIEHGQMYVLPVFAFATTAVDTSGNTITPNIASGERVAASDKIRITTSGSMPGGLVSGTDYYVRTVNAATGAFTLAASAALLADIDLTSQGSGTHTLTMQESADFPLQKLGSPQLEAHTRYLDSVFRYYYIQGDVLQVLPRGVAGNVAFSVPYYPWNLAALPDSLEAENIFLSVLKDIVTMGGGARAT